MTLLSRHDEWTVDDLDDLPDDGLQYELVDGVLIVSPAPRMMHQRVVGNLYVLLRAHAPAHLEVFLSPFDFQPTRIRSVQPDLLVVERRVLGEKGAVHEGLVLAVEVLSPSTRSKDALLKRAVYEEAGVPSYWMVDPDGPSLTVLELQDGTYVEIVHATGDEVVNLATPYPVEIGLAALVR